MDRDKAWLLQEKYHGEKTEGFFTDCQHLEAGEPLAYIIGSVPFLNCTIYLDSRPLTPRPETEFWVEKAIQAIQNKLRDTKLRDTIPKFDSGVRCPTPYLKVLDLCAGSGAIGVAVAKAIPDTRITFAELDPIHLPTIKKNLSKNMVVEPFIQMKGYAVLQSNLFKQLPTDTRYNFILSNPPYIDQDANTVETSVSNHEPHLALFGGRDGLELIKEIIKTAPTHLTPNGQLWIEHEPFQVDKITALALFEGYEISSYPDQYKMYRYSVLSLK